MRRRQFPRVWAAPNVNLREMTQDELKYQRHRFLRLADARHNRIEVLKDEIKHYDAIYNVYNEELQRRRDQGQ